MTALSNAKLAIYHLCCFVVIILSCAGSSALSGRNSWQRFNNSEKSFKSNIIRYIILTKVIEIATLGSPFSVG